MITIITYKKQGNGADSWHVDKHDCETEQEATRENRISREIVYTNPNLENKVSMENVDLNTMTEDQLNQLKAFLGL